MFRTIAGCTFLLFGLTAMAQTPGDSANCPMHAQHMQAAQTTQQEQQHEHHLSQSPYTTRTTLPVKALTSDTIDAYQNGTGNGMAIAAELNGYPGPRHVLDLAAKLDLSNEQKTAVQRIYDDMHAAAVPLGVQIIDAEKALDALFANGNASDREVARLTTDIATLQGHLRSTHLTAHLATKAVLTPQQIQAYNRERGYVR